MRRNSYVLSCRCRIDTRPKGGRILMLVYLQYASEVAGILSLFVSLYMLRR